MDKALSRVIEDFYWIVTQQIASTTGYSFVLYNLVLCLIILISTAIKDAKKYRMTPIYSLLSLSFFSVHQ